MQTTGWLIQNIKRAPGRFLGQLGCEFYALRFTTGKRRRRLPQPQITEPNIQHRIQFVRYARNISEKTRRFVHRQVEDVGDVLPLVSNLQRLTIVASPMAYFALDINVGHKMHLDLDQSAAFAIFAAAALDVKAKTSGIVATHSGGRQLRKQLPNRS